MRCKILSSARGCSLLAVCVNLSCLFKNKLGLIFFSRISFFLRILKILFRGNPQNRGKIGTLHVLCIWYAVLLNTNTVCVLEQICQRLVEVNWSHAFFLYALIKTVRTE